MPMQSLASSYEEDRIKSSQYQYMLRTALIAGLGGILFGYDTSVISGAIGPLMQYFNLSPAMTGWAVSSVVVGCIFGALSAGRLAGIFGRRGALMIAAFLFAITAIALALVTSFTTYTIWRIVCGFAVGIASCVTPMYISEVSPAEVRGRNVSLFQQCTVLGNVSVFFVNYFIARGMSEIWLVDVGWRWMLGSEVVPAILFICLLPLIPESPRWLIQKGREEKATQVLARLMPKSQIPSLIHSIKNSFENTTTLRQLFTNFDKPMLMILLIGSFVAFAQQLTAINIVMYYAPVVLAKVTHSTESALLQTSIMGVAFILGNLLGMMLIERLGRLPLMTIGSLGCVAGLTLLGYNLYVDSYGYGALFSLVIFVISYAISWGCVGWTLIAELFPNMIRHKAMAIAVACQWVGGFIVTQTFPMLDGNAWLTQVFNGAFSFWLYAIILLFCLWVVLKYVPETKGHSLESLEIKLRERFSKKVDQTSQALAFSSSQSKI